MNKKLLIVVDVQNDFITGALKNDLAKAKVPNIIKKINEHDGIVIATHDTHFTALQVNSAWPPADHAITYNDSYEHNFGGLPEHCIKLTDGWEIQKDVLDALTAKNTNGNHNFYALDKYTFGYTDWKKYLSDFDFDEIEICGFVTSICVMAQAVILRAIFPNMKITVDSNCVADLDEETQAAALKVLGMQQITVV